MTKFVQYNVPRDPAFQIEIRTLFTRVKNLKTIKKDIFMKYTQEWVLNAACINTDPKMAKIYIDIINDYDFRSVNRKEMSKVQMFSCKVDNNFWRYARLNAGRIPAYADYDMRTRDLVSASLIMMAQFDDAMLYRLVKSAPMLLSDSGRLDLPVSNVGERLQDKGLAIIGESNIEGIADNDVD